MPSSKIEAIIGGESAAVYTELLADLKPAGPENLAPHEFVKLGDGWLNDWLSDKKGKNSINGRVFEYLICETLAQQNILPFYYQAKFERVPNAEFDIVLYNPQRPVVLTMKRSLRERYKQADMEGVTLRQVYRRAESHLITLSHDEAQNVSRKISEGDVTGLDKCICADTEEYTELLSDLKKSTYSLAKRVMPISGKSLEKVKKS